MTTTHNDLAALQRWLESPRFRGLRRLHTGRDVLAQRGAIARDYRVARSAAEGFYTRLRELFAERRAITTFGPYSPGQAVAMKRAGIEAIYLGGWATSAKGALREDPGPDLASYPLGQVPEEAAPIVRALLTADRNQHQTRARSSAHADAAREIDFRPFIIADADTGHGGDAHVRNLIRRFVEVGVPGYHIEDQKSGAKKCGHQAGKLLVAVDEQIKRLSAARFQLDVMAVPGLLVARTDAESATLLDGRGDERDQPFLLGATNLSLPTFRAASLAVSRRFAAHGAAESSGHTFYALSASERAAADAWLEASGVAAVIDQAVASLGEGPADSTYQRTFEQFVEVWQREAGVKTFGEAVAALMSWPITDGDELPMTPSEWLAFASRASLYEMRERADEMDIQPTWDCEHVKTPDGYYQVRGGIDYAIAKSLAVAPYADLLWMETRTADLADARRFAEAIHAQFPDQLLAYNLSPSFNWDTTGMSESELSRFPEELGKLGYVFNFITYGGHQLDGLAAEELASSLREDGMLALARLQRKLRLVESPYRTPQTLVGGPRADAGLLAVSGRTSTTKAMGLGSTEYRHLVQAELPTQLLEGWLERWRARYDYASRLMVVLRPYIAGSDVLELAVVATDGAKLLDVVFAPVHDRQGRCILMVRDQNTFDSRLRKRRLMTLAQLFLIQRYGSDSIHYLTPNADNQSQAARLQARGFFRAVHPEVGEILVADVDRAAVARLVAAGVPAIERLIVTD